MQLTLTAHRLDTGANWRVLEEKRHPKEFLKYKPLSQHTGTTRKIREQKLTRKLDRKKK